MRPLREQRIDFIGGRGDARVRPQHDPVGAHHAKQLGDRPGIGVRLKEELLLGGEREHALHDGQARLTDVQVELTEAAVHSGSV